MQTYSLVFLLEEKFNVGKFVFVKESAPREGKSKMFDENYEAGR